MTVGLGILGCGSVFEAYARQIAVLERSGRVRVVAAFDPDPRRRDVARSLFPEALTDTSDAEAVIEHPDVDAVCVLTSMRQHASLAIDALTAGKDVLLEKPMATTLADGALLLEAAEQSERLLLCAPHVVLSPTFRALHDRLRQNDIGRVLSARARYGWQGPEWAAWYYEKGGGSIFDLGIYNIVSLCGLLGSVRNVSAMVGTAVESRRVLGADMPVEVDDTAHILMDFGDQRFACMTTGFVIRNMRSPAIELYGETGVLQLLGDDWAPNGFERWHADGGPWEIHAETAPTWPWTDGLPHFIDCIEEGKEPVLRPEHAYHALEIALAATTASSEGRTQRIESSFPALDYGTVARKLPGARFHHDPRNA